MDRCLHFLRLEYEAAGKIRKANITIEGTADIRRSFTIPAGQKSAKIALGLPADLNGLCVMSSHRVQIGPSTAKKDRPTIGPAAPVTWARATGLPCPLGPLADLHVTVLEPDDQTVSIDVFAVWDAEPAEPAEDDMDDKTA